MALKKTNTDTDKKGTKCNQFYDKLYSLWRL